MTTKRTDNIPSQADLDNAMPSRGFNNEFDMTRRGATIKMDSNAAVFIPHSKHLMSVGRACTLYIKAHKLSYNPYRPKF